MFGKRLNSDNDLADEIIEYIKNRTIPNTLKEEAETSKWNRRKIVFKSLSACDILDFPELTERDLKILFTGLYQFSQAVSYLAEMMTESDSPNIKYLKKPPNIIKMEIRSRHINSKTYRCYIEYNPNCITYKGIQRCTCDCANGNRTSGCCSHIAVIIYYLSHGRYLSRLLKSAEILSKIFCSENIITVINDDSDED